MPLNAGDVLKCEIALAQLKGRDGKPFPMCFKDRPVPKREMGRRSDHYDKLFAEWDTMPVLDRISHAALELYHFVPGDRSENAKIIHRAYNKLCTG